MMIEVQSRTIRRETTLSIRFEDTGAADRSKEQGGGDLRPSAARMLLAGAAEAAAAAGSLTSKSDTSGTVAKGQEQVPARKRRRLPVQTGQFQGSVTSGFPCPRHRRQQALSTILRNDGVGRNHVFEIFFLWLMVTKSSP